MEMIRFHLFYAMDGFIEPNKLVEEERWTHDLFDTERILNRCVDLVPRHRASAWDFSFRVEKKDGSCYTIGQEFSDREKGRKTYLVTYYSAWNVGGAPEKMSRAALMERVMNWIQEG